MVWRLLTALIGVWLSFSSFAWRHTPFHFRNSLLCGLLTITCAIASVYRRGAAYAGAAVAAWLFLVTIFSLTWHETTFWNNALVAIVLFATNLLAPSPPEERSRPARQSPA